MSSQVQEIYSILLTRSYYHQLFSDLQGQKKSGREIAATCPFCGREGHFSYSIDKPVWRCWRCGEAGDWIAYLEKRRNLQFVEALQELAAAAGVEVQGIDQQKYKAYTKRADLLEVAQDFFREQLHQPAGAPVLHYLQARGYTQEEIAGMGLGAYTDRDGLRKHLKEKGYTEEETRESGLLTAGFGDSHTLTYLWPDTAGRAVGIMARSLLTDQELKERKEPKYKASYGLQKDQGLIGLSSIRGSKQATLVEGVLDAPLLNYLGFKTVSVAGVVLSSEQIKALELAGVEELLLAMDQDQAGQQSTDRIIQSLRSSRLRAYVVSWPQEYKDPDEFVRQAGSQAFSEALELAESWPRWSARYIVGQFDLETDRGRDQAIDKALRFYTGLKDQLHQQDFLQSLEETIKAHYPILNLATTLERYQQEAGERQSREVLQGLLRTVQQKIEEGDITGAELSISQGLQSLRLSRGVEAPLSYLLEELVEDLQASPDSLKTGYATFDNVFRIPTGALSIIAGRPGHGKTTVQLNLLLKMIELYPDKRFYFFSYEEARARLAVKLIVILAGQVLDQRFNQEQYINYMRSARRGQPAIETAIQKYEELALTNRLTIDDKMRPAEDLAAVISYLAKRGDSVVFCDYIQKVPLLRPLQGQRYLEIKQVSQLLLEQAVKEQVPIILGAQLGRPGGETRSKVRLDNLRESGDIEQDASLVLGLYNESADKAEDEQKEIAGAEVDLEVSVLKNRAGLTGARRVLKLNRPILTLKDQPASGW